MEAIYKLKKLSIKKTQGKAENTGIFFLVGGVAALVIVILTAFHCTIAVSFRMVLMLLLVSLLHARDDVYGMTRCT